MIKNILATIVIIQGVLMGATLTKIDINGTEVPMIFEENRNLPIVSMQLIFQNSGTLSDSKNGLVKLTAKLLNEGTKKEGASGFATKLENRAISLGIHAGQETYVFDLDSLKSEFNYGVDLLKELILDPNYTEDTLEKIKKQTIGELKRKESDFDYISSLKMKGMLFPNTPLAKPSLGTVESIESIKLEDIKRYISEHLGLENVIVVIGGDINETEAKIVSKEVLSLLPHSHTQSIPHIKPIAQKKIDKSIVDSQQAYIYFGSPLNVDYNSSERYIARVASFILGSSGFGSRLMEEIRVKRGLAYSAYSRFSINKTNSYFSGYLQTKVSSGDEAVKGVQDVVKLFLDKGVTNEELTSAKQFLLGSEPLRNETLSQRLNRAFQEYYNERPLGAYVEDLKKIEGLTLKELNGFIKNHKEIENISFSVVTGK